MAEMPETRRTPEGEGEAAAAYPEEDTGEAERSEASGEAAPRDEGGDDPVDKRHRAAQLAKPAKANARAEQGEGERVEGGDVVVYAGRWDGVLLKFGKYKGGGKNTEYQNAHDEDCCAC